MYNISTLFEVHTQHQQSFKILFSAILMPQPLKAHVHQECKMTQMMTCRQHPHLVMKISLLKT